MKYIKNVCLTPSQAKELVHLGFILTLKSFNRIADEYEVWIKL